MMHLPLPNQKNQSKMCPRIEENWGQVVSSWLVGRVTPVPPARPNQPTPPPQNQEAKLLELSSSGAAPPRPGAPAGKRLDQGRRLTRIALGAGRHVDDGGPGARGAALERLAADAVVCALVGAGSADGVAASASTATRAGAGAAGGDGDLAGRGDGRDDEGGGGGRDDDGDGGGGSACHGDGDEDAAGDG